MLPARSSEEPLSNAEKRAAVSAALQFRKLPNAKNQQVFRPRP